MKARAAGANRATRKAAANKAAAGVKSPQQAQKPKQQQAQKPKQRQESSGNSGSGAGSGADPSSMMGSLGSGSGSGFGSGYMPDPSSMLGSSSSEPFNAAQAGRNVVSGPVSAIKALANSTITAATTPFPVGEIPKPDKTHLKPACPCAGILDKLDDLLHTNPTLTDNQLWVIEDVVNALLETENFPMCKCVDLSHLKRVLKMLKAAQYTPVKRANGVLVSLKESPAYKELGDILKKYGHSSQGAKNNKAGGTRKRTVRQKRYTKKRA